MLNLPHQTWLWLRGTVKSDAESTGAFDPKDVEDARRRTFAAIVRRQGQRAFRQQLLRAYTGRCAVTGCQITDILEAAHIVPYQGPHTNHVSNGLLLRADLHTLFDLGLLTVDDETMSVVVAPILRSTEYGRWEGCSLRLPCTRAAHPSKEAL